MDRTSLLNPLLALRVSGVYAGRSFDVETQSLLLLAHLSLTELLVV